MTSEQNTLFSQILHCLSVFGGFIVPAVLIIVPVRFLTKLPSYVFRKLLHAIAFTCVSLMILSADSWQAAALTSVLIAAAIYPILSAFEKAPWYGKLFVQKSAGEIKKSLLLLFFMFAALISVSWGIFGKPQLAAAAILMWGTGDAAAALVFPGTGVSLWLDRVGSVLVALYMLRCGIKTIRESHNTEA